MVVCLSRMRNVDAERSHVCALVRGTGQLNFVQKFRVFDKRLKEQPYAGARKPDGTPEIKIEAFDSYMFETTDGSPLCVYTCIRRISLAPAIGSVEYTYGLFTTGHTAINALHSTPPFIIIQTSSLGNRYVYTCRVKRVCPLSLRSKLSNLGGHYVTSDTSQTALAWSSVGLSGKKNTFF